MRPLATALACVAAGVLALTLGVAVPLGAAGDSEIAPYDREAFETRAICDGAKRDWYTGRKLAKRGSWACEVEHVVALADAWRSGAHAWGDAERIEFAHDPLNLVPAASCVNRSKSDRTPSKWLEAVKRSRACGGGYRLDADAQRRYCLRYLAVKAAWSLDIASADLERCLR